MPSVEPAGGGSGPSGGSGGSALDERAGLGGPSGGPGGPALDARGAAAAHAFVEDLSDPVLSPEDHRHLAGVLRLHAGELVTVSDGRGSWRPCRLERGGRLVAVGEIVREERPRPLVTIGISPVKGERTEWAVQKLTEVGVERVWLVSAERTVVRWEGQRACRHLDRLRAVARQAAMQSRRSWLPEVLGPIDFESAVSQGTGGVALAVPGGAPPALRCPTVLVGPEGGWSASELAAGLPAVGLGPSVMRTETAALAAGVLLVALRSGLVGDIQHAAWHR